MLVNNRIILLMCLGAALALSMGGCCTVGIGTCTQTDLITLNGSAQLNACGDDHKSHPVVVRFFYLNDSRGFNAAAFEDVWDDPMAALGGDLEGAYHDTALAPGAKETVSLTRPEGATAIVMMINFCAEGDLNSRRYVFSLKDKGLNKTVNLQGINFSVK